MEQITDLDQLKRSVQDVAEVMILVPPNFRTKRLLSWDEDAQRFTVRDARDGSEEIFHGSEISDPKHSIIGAALITRALFIQENSMTIAKQWSEQGDSSQGASFSS